MLRIFGALATLCVACLLPIAWRYFHSSLEPEPGTSELAMARALKPPEVTLRTKGEFEGGDWWDEQQPLLLRAWGEWGHLHEELFHFNERFEELYISTQLRTACDQLRSGASSDESDVLALFSEAVPGVWGTASLVTPLFVKHLREELDHMQGSGIPMRRPNGMNRFGCILDHVGFDLVLHEFSAKYLEPLAMAIFPRWIGKGDTLYTHTLLAKAMLLRSMRSWCSTSKAGIQTSQSMPTHLWRHSTSVSVTMVSRGVRVKTIY
jgi:hypothetical protein